MDAASHVSHSQDLDLQAINTALNRVQAVIEFELDGTILHANDNFLRVLGYTLAEVQGKHHAIFCDAEYVKTSEYADFWGKLGRGEFDHGEYKRRAKDGREVWINASYNPILDADGKPYKVIKFATDITASKRRNADYEGKIDAISKAQAVIEFRLDGTILDANDNFLKSVGYTLDEIKGQHHRMFCLPEYARSDEYAQFWHKLGQGQFDAGEYKRLTKDGREIWLNASYNPIFDVEGRPFKVVKFASDVTALKKRNAEYEGKVSAIGKAQAVIEFDMQGNVLDANDNFLAVMDYDLSDIQGEHHRMFCEPEYASSAEYKKFWQKLNRGEFDAGRYKRLGNHGKVVWIQATYNPILDLNGKPYKVVKFAIDISEQVNLENSIQSKAANDSRKVNALLDSVARAAQGDLTCNIVPEGDEPIDLLAGGISKMIVDLRGVIGNVVSAANGFADASHTIAERATGVAVGTQALGATVEEMNASIDGLTYSINSIAENTSNADFLAKATQQEAEAGARAVAKSIEAMDLINRSSEDIGEIVKVISEIANQTNMLAFNAAIEAARAGEHGLGFSVVADEVRKLAERSSQATKEISKLINESVKRVSTGSEISRQASDAFDKIVSGVAKTTLAISDISKAANEQLLTAREVSTAIQYIAEETEKSAANCDSIARSTDGLNERAGSLNQTVSGFVV
ncbi:methyl-accepting chemotaxis sensory transducer with Pas/Pac sensor [Janthinobacterium sp. 61]|nr:methyl-accepting chemotaxis sensory transducer with Pas/Pac sensor [Janthinobacterium sp. 61]